MKVENLDINDVNFLRELKCELNSQKSLWILNPRHYQVQHDKFVLTGNEYSEYFLAILEGEEIGVFENSNHGLMVLKEILLEYYKQEEEEIKEICIYSLDNINPNLNLKCFFGEYEQQYSNSFLTKKACEKHINSYKHHYRNPEPSLQYMDRNSEVKMLLEILSKIDIIEE